MLEVVRTKEFKQHDAGRTKIATAFPGKPLRLTKYTFTETVEIVEVSA